VAQECWCGMHRANAIDDADEGGKRCQVCYARSQFGMHPPLGLL
jgi:predicted adenine nucleotide alpha hydrolase (AANH) superfamily ATPase